jgi:hypothetical protein
VWGRRSPGCSEKDTKLAQNLGQLQPFTAVFVVFPTGMHGPTCVFWANLTPFSRVALSVEPAMTAGGDARALHGVWH